MDIKQGVRIKLDTEDPNIRAYLENLAERLGLDAPSASTGSARFYLRLNNSTLELHKPQADTHRRTPLVIDFLSGPPYYRFVNDRRISQPLARAVGIKPGYRPSVVDATAGFGEDSFVLATLGCRVTMIERSPIIWALLENAISRCSINPHVDKVFTENVTLVLGESRDILNTAERRFDAIYLDPMYPARQKSSLNKEKMRFLRELVGDDPDDGELLRCALEHAARRVAVKRPSRGNFLGNMPPDFSIRSKSSRFDIYLADHL